MDGIACIRIADPEVKRILVSIFDADKNGEINEDEVDGITRIGRYNFSGNTLIKSFDEMNKFTNLVNIEIGSFMNCTSLESISFPDHLTSFGQQVCNACTSLKKVHLPNSLTHLGGGCFNNCSSLREITIPEGVTVLDSFANTALEEIKIPNATTSIKGFAGCIYLKKVDIGTGVTEFKQSAFQNCDALEVFIMRAVTPPSYAGWTLPDGFSGTIYVPDASVNAYKTASGWSGRASKIKPLSEYNG
ncbi:leucine-rich repeat domain-containing protein [Bacteroides sp. GD17]|uniref:leucine-rich repeat domain-containing protein n=1 Tax=Bacteroides sp. GD17 TaxID=3139826 RepID=UPI00313F15BA